MKFVNVGRNDLSSVVLKLIKSLYFARLLVSKMSVWLVRYIREHIRTSCQHVMVLPLIMAEI